MATKPGKMVTCHEKLSLKKLRDPIIKWFCEAT